ncbi:MAG: hypothetical protein HN757_09600 [Calditrichaeota bacterium]|jgi:hypothetical protein|nr:hypothetical protein [Calditrichota bacterium]
MGEITYYQQKIKVFSCYCNLILINKKNPNMDFQDAQDIVFARSHAEREDEGRS